jgi:hypothetical protein
MRCEDTAGRLARRADSAPEGTTGDELARHLARCAACGEALRVQRQVAEVLASRPSSQPRPGLAQRVNDRIDNTIGWLNVADWRVWTWRLVPVAVALMVIASLGLFGSAGEGTVNDTARPATVDAWMGGTSTGTVPATAVFWQPSVSQESLLMTVLTASPDATLGETRR